MLRTHRVLLGLVYTANGQLFQDFGIFNSTNFAMFLNSMSDLETEKHIFVSRRKQDLLGSAAASPCRPQVLEVGAAASGS